MPTKNRRSAYKALTEGKASDLPAAYKALIAPINDAFRQGRIMYGEWAKQLESARYGKG